MWRKRNPHILLVGLQIATVTMENSMEVPQKTKNWSTIWPSNPSTGYSPQRLENPYLKRYLHTNVHSSSCHSGQDMKATEVPCNRWLAKEAVVHIYNGILLSHRRDEILPFATTWMDLESIMLREISQTEKVEITGYHLYVGYKPKSNKWTRQTNRDSWIWTID